MIITGATKSIDRIEDEEFLQKRVATVSEVIDKKSALQNRAVDYSHVYSHLVLSWATGCGKSLAALKIIKSRIDAGDTTPWFIVCSELNHVDNWISEIVKHKLGYLMEYIEIFCYASLGKYKNKTANLILDEAHSVSDLRLDHLVTIQSKNIVSLSATLNSNRKFQLRNLRQFREFEVTMTDAINVGILPAPKIFVVYDKLNNESHKSYQTYIKKKGSSPKKKNTVPKIEANYDGYFAALKANKDLNMYELHVKCNEKQYYDLITNDLEYYKSLSNKPISSIYYKNRMLQLGNDRKTFVANKKKDILFSLDNMLSYHQYRHITFTGSIEQCDEIGKDRAVHSRIPQKKRREIIQSFNSKEIDSIYAVQMLREGMNLENIEAGIITQLDSEDLSFVQMMGRVFRSASPILFVIVKDNTQDITYLKNCIDGLDNKYITYVEYTPENMKALNNILCQRKTAKKA